MTHHDDGYANRADAGRQLATALSPYFGQDVLVLGIPRGGVPVAAEVARGLDARMDVIVARKLGAPYQPELAIGAVTANGGLFLDNELIADLGVRDAYIDQVVARNSDFAHRRETRLRGAKPAPSIEGHIVIVVDDGLATGATMRAAVRSVRQHHPARLVVAVPVGSREACTSLSEEADDVVCLRMPEPFIAVGLYYSNFLPVEDSEVEAIIAEYATHHGAAPSQPTST